MSRAQDSGAGGFGQGRDALDALTPLERVRIADRSEAQAYRSLAACAGAAGADGFRALELGGALLLHSRAVRNSVLFNRTIGLGCGDEVSVPLLERIAAVYAQADADGGARVPWAIEVSVPVETEAFRSWLKARRMRRGLATAMLMRPCDRLPEVKTDLRVERVGSEFSPACRQIWAEVFRVAEPVQALLEHAASAPAFRQWVAFDGEKPVACSLSHVVDRVAWLGWSATLPSHRGRGAQNALLAARLLDAREAGCEWATSETAMGTAEQPDPSYRNLLRSGFSLAYERYMHIGLGR